ncbi:WD40 repeat-like protein [Dentipellis sp. KUC8613]|nr:WD40 repeat-like protein [Dentipellis sp. KUC8613]
MASTRFRLEHTIRGHTDSVNALSFSHDARFLASGSDDGLIRFFDTVKYDEVRRYRCASSITALVWNERFPYTLIAGDRSGDIHVIRLRVRVFVGLRASEVSTNLRHDERWLRTVNGPIHCLATGGDFLAVGFENSVILVKQGAPSEWNDNRRLPEPPSFPELVSKLPSPTARSLHFIPKDNTLIVTYLDHGIVAWSTSTFDNQWQIRPRSCRIGASSLAPSGCTIAVTNLCDGVDWYSLMASRFSPGGKFTNTTPFPYRDNVMIPISHSYDGSFVAVGGTSGVARLIDADGGQMIQDLEHGGQAFTYKSCDIY